MAYNNLNRETVIKIYRTVLNLKKAHNLGQRKITTIINKKFEVNISENTIAGWLYSANIPYAQEKTQFKAKPKPKKNILQKLYCEQKISASKLAKKFGVSTIIAINWLNYYGIKPRSHKESMNTLDTHAQLRSQRLTYPTKSYTSLTPEKAYVLGVLCGDAHINKKFIRLEIRYDKEFIAEFLKCVKEVYGTTYAFKYYTPRNSFVAYVASEIVCNDLLKYGKFGTFEWRAPEIISHKSKDIIAGFLKGYFDSEGCVHPYKIDAASVNLNALKDVQILLEKLEIKSKIYSGKKYHTIVVSRKENIRKFKEKIGLTIKRKQQRLNEMYQKWQ